MTAKIDDYEPEDLEMTFPALDGRKVYEPHRRPPRPRVAPKKPMPKLPRNLVRSLVLVAFAIAILVSSTCATNRAADDLEALDVRIATLEDDVAQRDDKITSLEASLTDATDAVDELTTQLEDEHARAEQYKLFAEEASSTIATLQQQKATPKVSEPSAPKIVQATWTGSVEQWRPLAEKYFGPLGGNRVEEALLCVSIETGGTGNPNAVSPTGKYVGLFQMDSGWGTDAQRRDPEYVFACAADSVAKNGGWDQWPPMVNRGY